MTNAHPAMKPATRAVSGSNGMYPLIEKLTVPMQVTRMNIMIYKYKPIFRLGEGLESGSDITILVHSMHFLS